jgi:hypothetical protein
MPSVRLAFRWTPVAVRLREPRSKSNTPWIAGALALLVASGCSSRSGNPARIATGYVSHVVCSYVFVSGLDPARVNDEQIAGNPVFSGFNWALSHEVDRARREVKARAVGGLESRAIYRDGLGCLNLNGAHPPWIIRVAFPG